MKEYVTFIYNARISFLQGQAVPLVLKLSSITVIQEILKIANAMSLITQTYAHSEKHSQDTTSSHVPLRFVALQTLKLALLIQKLEK